MAVALPFLGLVNLRKDSAACFGLCMGGFRWLLTENFFLPSFVLFVA